MVTATFSPGSAVPHTQMGTSRCRTMWSLNSGCGLTSARAAAEAASTITAAMSNDLRKCIAETPMWSMRRREPVGYCRSQAVASAYRAKDFHSPHFWSGCSIVSVMSILTVQDVTKTFSTVKAVGGVSFDVRRGEIFALLGPNG